MFKNHLINNILYLAKIVDLISNKVISPYHQNSENTHIIELYKK